MKFRQTDLKKMLLKCLSQPHFRGALREKTIQKWSKKEWLTSIKNFKIFQTIIRRKNCPSKVKKN